MSPLPQTENALVIRTDFTDDDAWREVCQIIETPADDFDAHVEFVEDPAHTHMTVE